MPSDSLLVAQIYPPWSSIIFLIEKDYLELSDFEVEIENTGDAGLSRAMSEDFDLVILDLMLPGMDGFETFWLLPTSLS